MNNWIEIDAQALTANYHDIQHQIGPETEVLAVIKANAYGHGAEHCAPILVRAGARWLGVTCASEGQRVRTVLDRANLEAEILIMCGFFPSDVPIIRTARLTPVLWTSEQVTWLSGTDTRLHIEVDTGMGRQGIPPGPELDALLQQIQQTGLELEAIFTHFCSSEEAHSPLTLMQQTHFAQAVAQVHSVSLQPTYIHAGNTSTVDNPAPGDRDPWLPNLATSISAKPMVRTGLALYGHTLPIQGPAAHHLRPTLQPVLIWKAHILSIRALAPGDTIGYNATFTAPIPMHVALLPVGYADGLRRELSSINGTPNGWVILHAHRAPILGRISMNLTVVDVTAIPNAAPGDEATILGPGITAEDHARLAHTIPYEILCGIHPCA